MSILEFDSPTVAKLDTEETSKIVNINEKYLANVNGKEKIIKIEEAYNVRFDNKDYVRTYFSYSYEEEKKQNLFQKLFNLKKETIILKPKTSFYTSDFYSEFSPENVVELSDLKTVVNW